MRVYTIIPSGWSLAYICIKEGVQRRWAQSKTWKRLWPEDNTITDNRSTHGTTWKKYQYIDKTKTRIHVKKQESNKRGNQLFSPQREFCLTRKGHHNQNQTRLHTTHNCSSTKQSLKTTASLFKSKQQSRTLGWRWRLSINCVLTC